MLVAIYLNAKKTEKCITTNNQRLSQDVQQLQF